MPAAQFIVGVAQIKSSEFPVSEKESSVWFVFHECSDNNSRENTDMAAQHINFGSGQHIARLAGLVCMRFPQDCWDIMQCDGKWAQ